MPNHFYNQSGFGVVIYSLAQTSIRNFRDVLAEIFGVLLENEINWHLLPLGIRSPIDPVAFISGSSESSGKRKQSNAVRQFLHELAEAAREVKEAGADDGRLLTIFNVKLEPVKKIGDADVVVGIDKAVGGSGPLAVVRTQDPNVTHPLRQKEVLEKVGTLHGRPITSHVFQAIAWHHDLKSKPRYCWRAQEGILTRYSNDVVAYMKRLTSTDVDKARSAYRAHLRTRHNAKNPTTT